MPQWTKGTTILKAHTSSSFKSIFAWPVFPTNFYTLWVNIDLHLQTDPNQCDLPLSPHSFATLHQSLLIANTSIYFPTFLFKPSTCHTNPNSACLITVLTQLSLCLLPILIMSLPIILQAVYDLSIPDPT